jgi:hypothetical protein
MHLFSIQPREITLRVGRIGSADAWALIISGLNSDDETVELVMHFTHLNYAMKVVKTQEPLRFGFVTERPNVA